MRMKGITYLLLVVLCSVLSAGETWTLTNKKNQSIEVDYIFYDGVKLSCRKVGSINKFKISPDDLSEESWNAIQKSFGNSAVVELEVKKTTRTSTDSQRTSYGYGYSRKRKETEKLNQFSIEVESSSYFTSNLKVEYFIFADDEVKYGRLPATVSMRKPFETMVEQLMTTTEYSAKSMNGGTYYRSERGEDKAWIGVILLNENGEEVAEYASSEKIKARMHGIKHAERSKYKPQKNRGGNSHSAQGI